MYLLSLSLSLFAKRGKNDGGEGSFFATKYSKESLTGLALVPSIRPWDDHSHS